MCAKVDGGRLAEGTGSESNGSCAVYQPASPLGRCTLNPDLGLMEEHVGDMIAASARVPNVVVGKRDHPMPDDSKEALLECAFQQFLSFAVVGGILP